MSKLKTGEVKPCRADQYFDKVQALGREAFDCQRGHDLCALWPDGPCSEEKLRRCRCKACRWARSLEEDMREADAGRACNCGSCRYRHYWGLDE